MIVKTIEFSKTVNVAYGKTYHTPNGSKPDPEIRLPCGAQQHRGHAGRQTDSSSARAAPRRKHAQQKDTQEAAVKIGIHLDDQFEDGFQSPRQQRRAHRDGAPDRGEQLRAANSMAGPKPVEKSDYGHIRK